MTRTDLTRRAIRVALATAIFIAAALPIIQLAAKIVA